MGTGGAPDVDLQARAITLARAGDVERAVELLRTLHVAAPLDLAVRADLAVVLHWARDDQEALAVGGELPVATTPLYALEAMAEAARDLGRFEEAAGRFGSVLAREPGRASARLGWVLALAESGEVELALAEAERLQRGPQPDTQILHGLAYLHRRFGEPVRALGLYNTLVDRNAADGQVLAARALILAELGGSGLALELAEPGGLAPSDLTRIRGDVAAMLVRWGELPYGVAGVGPRADSERALMALDRAVAELALEDPAHLRAAHLRARYDRLVALRDLTRMGEVVTECEALDAQGRDLPPFAVEACADALLYQRRPTEAVAHYERTLAVAPEHFEAAIGRFYALLEDERWQDAVDHIDALLGSSANDRWQGLSAAVTAAMARAYGDRGAQAQRRLEALERIAPLDTGLHQALATVYRWRGWSRRATDELAYALALDPEHVASRILLGHLLLDDGRYAEARHALSALRDRAPGNVHVERLGDELDASRGWGIDVRFEQGSSAGAARETPESGGTLEIRGAALGLGLRPVIGLEWSGGEFPEGELRRQGAALRLVRNVGRSSGSLGLRLDQVQPGSALAGQHFEHDDLGWAGSLGYRLSETTRIDGGFEQASRDVPIRGRRLGIEGTQTWAQFGWRPSDVASLSLRLSSLDLSDGNRREGALVLGERRVSVTPRLALTPGFELYASRGEAIATPYFNPLRDASMVGSLAIEHVLSRRYERSLRQRLSVSLGSYWQEDFGGEPMFSVRYEHRWQRRPWRDLGYGIGFARRPYDGQQEERFWLFLSLGWRLR